MRRQKVCDPAPRRTSSAYTGPSLKIAYAMVMLTVLAMKTKTAQWLCVNRVTIIEMLKFQLSL